MDLIGTKRPCLLCDKEGNKIVEIIDVIPEGDDFRQKLSCGHTSKYVAREIKEKIEIKDKLDLKVIKFRTLTEGPILVSDNSGTSVASGSFQGTVVNGNVTAGTINFNSIYKLEINNSTAINQLNIQNILSMVDSNNTYTKEEKDQIKEEVSKAEKILKSIGTVSDKAAPYVQLLLGLLQRSG